MNAAAFSTPLRPVRTSTRPMDSSKRRLSSSVSSVVEETEIDADVTSLSRQCGKGGEDDFFGLPPRVKQLFADQRGINKLYDWQKECLTKTSVSNGANLVYSLPTSGGKTLVAEILMLKELLLQGKNVLFILPFVSIVQEKVRSLTLMGLELGFWVEEYAGSRGRIPPVKRRGSHSVLIATIEKAHTIVNSLIETKDLASLGLVIVDELHMIGEGGSRGACLEMTLTKLRLVSPHTRIIGMSATLANMHDLTDFLNAELYTSTFRPVRLTEYVKLGDHLYEITARKPGTVYQNPEELLADRLKHRRMVNFQYSKMMVTRDPDHLVGLVAETLEGYSMQEIGGSVSPPNKRFSCLVFCPTKVHCENTARMLAELLPQEACFPPVNTEELVGKRCDLIENLRIDALPDQDEIKSGKKNHTGSCCPILEVTVPRGVAYHHSGLTQEERSALEEAFSDGTLSVLCCTSTLAAGVNLPARRVIVRKPYIGNSFISSSQYQQIIGRAGRAGLDSEGESITILQSNDRGHFASMLRSIGHTPCSDTAAKNQDGASAGLCCSSLLYDGGKGARQLLLSLIGLEVTVNYVDIVGAIDSTLFAIQANRKRNQRVREVVDEELEGLMKRGLIIATSGDESYSSRLASTLRGDITRLQFQATKLGRAAIRGGLDADQVSPLLNDLRMAARAMNVSGRLHLLYLVAPPDVVETVNLDWTVLYNRLNALPPSEANLLILLGFPEGYVLWKATGYPIRKKLDERPLRRLYIALILLDMWQTASTTPVWQIAERYKLSRGSLQSLLASAAALASSLGRALSGEYSTDEELWSFAYLLPEFANRLAYCVSSELLPLMELPGVKRARARLLYSAGFCTLKDIACAKPVDLTVRLSPFLSRRAATDIVHAARMLVSERADALRQEASDLLTGVRTKSVMSQLAEDLTFQPFTNKNTSLEMRSNDRVIDQANFSPTLSEDEDLFS